jgi:hypothetical protein
MKTCCLNIWKAMCSVAHHIFANTVERYIQTIYGRTCSCQEEVKLRKNNFKPKTHSTTIFSTTNISRKDHNSPFLHRHTTLYNNVLRLLHYCTFSIRLTQYRFEKICHQSSVYNLPRRIRTRRRSIPAILQWAPLLLPCIVL